MPQCILFFLFICFNQVKKKKFNSREKKGLSEVHRKTLVDWLTEVAFENELSYQTLIQRKLILDRIILKYQIEHKNQGS